MITKIPVQTLLLTLLIRTVHTDEKNVERGEWSEWSEFSPCSVTCGSGTYRRTRHWKPSPNEPASLVNFTSTQELPCSREGHMLCPVEGNWSYWSGWSPCSRACGGGTMKRTRTCTSPMPSFGGKGCEGESWEAEDCNKLPCPPLPANFNISACAKSDFMCSSGKMCISREQFCDDIVQCHDGSDEERCYNFNDDEIGSVRYRFSKSGSQLVYLSGSLLAAVWISNIFNMLML